MRVVILLRVVCAHTHKLRSLRPHDVAPEVVALRHGSTWNVREVGDSRTNARYSVASRWM